MAEGFANDIAGELVEVLTTWLRPGEFFQDRNVGIVGVALIIKGAQDS